MTIKTLRESLCTPPPRRHYEQNFASSILLYSVLRRSHPSPRRAPWWRAARRGTPHSGWLVGQRRTSEELSVAPLPMVQEKLS